MDTQPILDRIREDAREAAQKLLREAEDRVMTIHEQADLRVAGMRLDTEDKAREGFEWVCRRAVISRAQLFRADSLVKEYFARPERKRAGENPGPR